MICQKKKKVIYFDSKQQIHEKEEIEELTGKLSFQQVEDKLMHSVLERNNRKRKINF